MSPLGWVFLIVSLGFVWGLTLWCYYKVLTMKEPPPRELEEFHST